MVINNSNFLLVAPKMGTAKPSIGIVNLTSFAVSVRPYIDVKGQVKRWNISHKSLRTESLSTLSLSQIIHTVLIILILLIYYRRWRSMINYFSISTVPNLEYRLDICGFVAKHTYSSNDLFKISFFFFRLHLCSYWRVECAVFIYFFRSL